jgi:hypothetical protein
MLTRDQVHYLDLAIGKPCMIDAVQISLPLYEIYFPRDGIDFHEVSLWPKGVRSQSV